MVDFDKSKNMLIRANKSRNLSKIDPPEYKNISKNKKTEKYTLDHDNNDYDDIDYQINKDSSEFTKKLNIKTN